MNEVLRLRFLSGQPGQKGADGTNGTNGADGAPGSAGPPGTPGTGFSAISQNVQTATYTVVAGDAGKAVVMNAASAATLNLTAAAVLGAGFAFIVCAEGAGAVTIDPNGSETINGATTLLLYQGDSALVWTDGANWRANVAYRPRSKLVSFTRDISLTSSLPIAGAGFQPTRVQFMGAPSSAGTPVVHGMADQSLGAGAVSTTGAVTGGLSNANALLLAVGGANYNVGTIASFDADGCTINPWAKTGSPTGTIVIFAMFSR